MLHEFGQFEANIVRIAEDSQLYLRCVSTQFESEVSISDSDVYECNMFGAYFLRGFSFERNHFFCQVDWQAGGHNERPIVLRDCIFEEFVDFEDCYFTAGVLFERVNFRNGTNLFGNKGTPMEVTWEVQPQLIQVSGNVDIDSYKSHLE